MNTIVLIGGGGRENALANKLRQDAAQANIIAMPGNAGIAQIPNTRCVPISANDIDGILAECARIKPDLVFVAPDDPLALGLVDKLQAAGIRTFGPSKAASEVEWSKAFSKDFMQRHNIPTAKFVVFNKFEEASKYIKTVKHPIVIKANGLALGKGVIISGSSAESLAALEEMMLKKQFGASGETVIIEEFLTGPEITLLVFTDGKSFALMPSSQDHKRAYDNDEGLNTGGMGAFSPAAAWSSKIEKECIAKIVKPTIDGLMAEGRAFKGVLYFGLMVTADGVKVIEYNARFGDPECQTVLPLLKTNFIDVIDACIDGTLNKLKVEWLDKTALCVVVAAKEYPLAVKKGLPVTLGKFDKKVSLIHCGTLQTKDGLVTNGGRVFCLTTVQDTMEEARKIIYSEIKKINFEGARYRMDIGKTKEKKYALMSVSDKTGVAEFAAELVKLGYEIISSGGTSKHLQKNGVACKDISDITGFPECLDGRVKTLHPIIHAGILAMRSNPEHVAQLKKLGVTPIDIVCVNLYPFLETIKKPNVSFEDAVENIDIGGPTMIRAAAKNYQDVLPVCYPESYKEIIQKLKSGEVDIEYRKHLQAQAFGHTAFYDSVVSNFLNTEKFPQYITHAYEKAASMRYGENPHQQACFYRDPITHSLSLSGAEQLGGKELSFNNINDTNGAIAALGEHEVCACVAVKHATPCAVAVGKTPYDAYMKAYEADSESIFGGIVAFNRTVDAKTAVEMAKIFLEVIIAPDYTKEAVEILTKKANLRVLRLAALADKSNKDCQDKKFVTGGVLVQDKDIADYDLQVPTKVKPGKATMDELLFAFKVAKHLKSNAIAISNNNQTVGLGGGQTSRVEAVRIALGRAGERSKDAVLASDGFFPFNDCIEMAVEHGVRAIIQPGGSKNDANAIEACDKAGIPMVMTGIRHFKH